MISATLAVIFGISGRTNVSSLTNFRKSATIPAALSPNGFPCQSNSFSIPLKPAPLNVLAIIHVGLFFVSDASLKAANNSLTLCPWRTIGCHLKILIFLISKLLFLFELFTQMRQVVFHIFLYDVVMVLDHFDQVDWHQLLQQDYQVYKKN